MAGELILIVEDNEINRKLLRDLLQVNGYHTLESKTGEAGIRLALDHHPSLVLMDIQLPGMNGIETLKRLRTDSDTAAIPVMAVTASVMEHDRIRIDKAGFDGYHWKPIDVKGILQEVRRLLDE